MQAVSLRGAIFLKRKVYADHAATTALSKLALAAMRPFFEGVFGNPSALYHDARQPRQAIAAARASIAADIGARPEEIFFTSGGSESDNWALKGRAFLFPCARKRLVTTVIEHHAVLHAADFLERCGYEIVRLPVDGTGLVSPEVLEAALTGHEQETALVSCMMVNNEIGTIEPIRELASVAHRHGVPFHTDAVQAIGHLSIDVERLGIDMLSASAHKFNGPRGVGFLYVRQGLELVNLVDGGAQERGLRAGTENTAGIVGMAAALRENMEHLQDQTALLKVLSRALLDSLVQEGVEFRLNGPALEKRMPGSFSLSFANADGEALLHRLDLLGIEVATGSACNSRETVTSHVLQAINVPEKYIGGTLRVTLGRENTMEDVHTIVQNLKKLLLCDQSK